MLVKHCHLQDAEDVARAEDIRCESVSLFHLFYLFINSSGTFWSCFGVGVLLFGGCLFVLFFVCFGDGSWPVTMIEVSNNEFFSTAS